MRDFRSIINIIGLLLCIEALAMTIPMFIDLVYNNEDWKKFFFSSLITFFIGIVLFLKVVFIMMLWKAMMYLKFQIL